MSLVIDPQSVRDNRYRKAWTQADLADKVAMNPQSISRIERGEASPRLSTIRRIAEAFEVEPLTLMKQSRAA